MAYPARGRRGQPLDLKLHFNNYAAGIILLRLLQQRRWIIRDQERERKTRRWKRYMMQMMILVARNINSSVMKNFEWMKNLKFCVICEKNKIMPLWKYIERKTKFCIYGQARSSKNLPQTTDTSNRRFKPQNP